MFEDFIINELKRVMRGDGYKDNTYPIFVNSLDNENIIKEILNYKKISDTECYVYESDIKKYGIHNKVIKCISKDGISFKSTEDFIMI